jgi:hypothetical protein
MLEIFKGLYLIEILGVSGRFTYAYDERYFSEFNFGYNGSERFAKSERFGFFPSFGFGWYMSNEDFMSSTSDVITKLKLKSTYGLVGNDQIGSAEDRFFYISQVNLNDGVHGSSIWPMSLATILMELVLTDMQMIK